jgi:hypothetical protein
MTDGDGTQYRVVSSCRKQVEYWIRFGSESRTGGFAVGRWADNALCQKQEQQLRESI